jgi:hypothetical protein
MARQKAKSTARTREQISILGGRHSQPDGLSFTTVHAKGAKGGNIHGNIEVLELAELG